MHVNLWGEHFQTKFLEDRATVLYFNLIPTCLSLSTLIKKGKMFRSNLNKQTLAINWKLFKFTVFH